MKCAAQSMNSNSTARSVHEGTEAAVNSEVKEGVTGGVGIGSSARGVREMMRYERRSFESVRGPLRYLSINSKDRTATDEGEKKSAHGHLSPSGLSPSPRQSNASKMNQERTIFRLHAVFQLTFGLDKSIPG